MSGLLTLSTRAGEPQDFAKGIGPCVGQLGIRNYGICARKTA
jgi:hypothetical protein